MHRDSITAEMSHVANKQRPSWLNSEKKKDKRGRGGGRNRLLQERVRSNLRAILTWKRVLLSGHSSGINQIKIHFSKSIPRCK